MQDKATRWFSSFAPFAWFMAAALLSLPGCAPETAETAKEPPPPSPFVYFSEHPLRLAPSDNLVSAVNDAAGMLGQRCGWIESYGWRTVSYDPGQSDGIINGSVRNLEASGYDVDAKNLEKLPTNAALYTVERENQKFVLLWLNGHLGLVAVVCGMHNAS